MRYARMYIFLVVLLSGFLALAQVASQKATLEDHLKHEVILVNQPLGRLMHELSLQTEVAICVEDVMSDTDSGLLDMPVTITALKRDSISQVLDRVRSLYPRVHWTVTNGIIILRDGNLEELKDDPLLQKANATRISGTIDAVTSFLMSGIEDFSPAIAETKGAVDREALFDLQISSGMPVRKILAFITQKTGLRWRARISLERKRSKGGLVEQPRVLLSFTNGSVPKELSDPDDN